MFNWIYKILIRRKCWCCMEMHNNLGCFFSICHPSNSSIEGFKKFFDENNFIVSTGIFNEYETEENQLNEIYKKISFVYKINPKNSKFEVIKGNKKVYFPDYGFYFKLPSDGMILFNKERIKAFS